MKPITNILLVLALICYVFLPFYVLSIIGTVTGLGFTAGTISQFQPFNRVVLALTPFVACFGAIFLNSLKRRWWILGAIVFILAWLFIWLSIYMDPSILHDISLQHAPEVTPDNDPGEGFPVIGTSIGYKLSFLLTCLALLSALISLLPFKFNKTIEKAVDDKFEDGRRHVREEFKRFEHGHKGNKAKNIPEAPIEQADDVKPAEPPIEDKEDPSRFMPKE